MKTNALEELQNKKHYIVSSINKALNYGWLDKQRHDEMLSKLNNDILTIGVIGQMKCGKSTFLNSFIFENDILPSATTPMTAALSVITYGDTNKISAEFYTQEEWLELKNNASRSFDNIPANSLEESKIKVAKELVSKSAKLGNELNNLLGNKKEDDIDNLIEYVGADGKYISIVKSVTIYCNKEYLKGVQIVDTPGFNDPIVSREERTKDFLRNADVVLLLLYAGRPFDANDRQILFENVKKCGIDKVIIGINKYDIPYQNGDSEDEIKEYVKQEINKASKAEDESSLKSILENIDPIPLSAEMALLAKLPMDKIMNNEAYKFSWNRLSENFEISSQSQFLEKSYQHKLSKAILDLIENDKGKILFEKPLNTLKVLASEQSKILENKIFEAKNLLLDLNKPDIELEEKKNKLKRAKKQITTKIENLEDDITKEINKIISSSEENIEDSVDAYTKKQYNKINEYGILKSLDALISDLDNNTHTFLNRDLKRMIKKINEKTLRSVSKLIESFFEDVEDILIKRLPDYDSKDYISKIKKEIELKTADENLFQLSSDEEQNEESLLSIIGGTLFGAICGGTFGIAYLAFKALNIGETKQNLKQYYFDNQHNFNAKEYLSHITISTPILIERINTVLMTELLNPLLAQIDEIFYTIKDKEAKREETQKQLEEFKHKQEEINKQIIELNL